MDTPYEPSGAQLEWDSLLRDARITARDLLRDCKDAHDFAMLVESLETLASFDPAYSSQFDDEDVASEDTVAVPESDAPDDSDDEKDDDEDDGGSSVSVPDKVTQ